MRKNTATILNITVLVAVALTMAPFMQQRATAQAVKSKQTVLASESVGAPERCAAMKGVKLGAGVVERVDYVKRGSDMFENVAEALAALKAVKAGTSFCRVRAVLHPVPASEIRAEVYLPDEWNGKLVAMGGGGFSGGLDIALLVLGTKLARGYAGAATDVGHKTSEGARWAYSKPEQVIDYGHRGNHETAVFAKAAVARYYEKPAKRALFWGCSNGGRDALMEAHRYPDDYDGIVAGAPANNFTGLATSFVWNYRALFQSPGASTLTTKVKLVKDAINVKCDELDGVADGVLETPLACRFEPSDLQCKAEDSANCLTAAEVEALRKIYRGPRTKDGRSIFAGYAIGGEDIPENKGGWLDPGKNGTGNGLGTEFFRWMVYQDPEWTPERFDLDRDYRMAVKRMGPILDSNDPDLRKFVKRGGKLILYHGWYDALIPAEASLRYYEAVRKKLGPAADQIRLFMVPGMAHCGGGPGPVNFDMLGELDNWIENGAAPERVVATKYENDKLAFIGLPTKPVRTRPLCAWPKIAQYNGNGSTDDAANFTCKATR